MKLSPTACPIAAVMIHVADIAEGLNWYARAFPDAVRRTFPDSPFEYLDCGGVMLELVPADAKVQSGAAGSVVYWQVENFAAALTHLQSLGAELYRGPMQIEGGQRMCHTTSKNSLGIQTIFPSGASKRQYGNERRARDGGAFPTSLKNSSFPYQVRDPWGNPIGLRGPVLHLS